MNFLASPPLVVAYALAGNMNIDLTNEPLGTGKDGKPVFLKDIWPTRRRRLHDLIAKHVNSAMFKKSYCERLRRRRELERRSTCRPGENFTWDDESTYVKHPPYFEGMTRQHRTPQDIPGARVLAMLGDSVTTDHISPAGNIAADSPAGKYLIEHRCARSGLQLVRRAPRQPRGHGPRHVREHSPAQPARCPEPKAADDPHAERRADRPSTTPRCATSREGTPLIILAGKEYGAGSSRDWAAKGTALLGVRAVIAESYERIHRSNLIGMGVVPLQFRDGDIAPRRSGSPAARRSTSWGWA